MYEVHLPHSVEEIRIALVGIVFPWVAHTVKLAKPMRVMFLAWDGRYPAGARRRSGSYVPGGA